MKFRKVTTGSSASCLLTLALVAIAVTAEPIMKTQECTGAALYNCMMGCAAAHLMCNTATCNCYNPTVNHEELINDSWQNSVQSCATADDVIKCVLHCANTQQQCNFETCGCVKGLTNNKKLRRHSSLNSLRYQNLKEETEHPEYDILILDSVKNTKMEEKKLLQQIIPMTKVEPSLPLRNTKNIEDCTGTAMMDCMMICAGIQRMCDVRTCTCQTHVLANHELSNNATLEQKSDERKNSTDKNSSKGFFMCKFCEEIMDEITREFLKTNQSKEAIEDVLHEVCNHFPIVMRVECEQFMRTYGDEIVEKILAKQTAKMMCEAFGFCYDVGFEDVGSDVSSTEIPLPLTECRNIYGDQKYKGAEFINGGCTLTCVLENGSKTNNTLWNGLKCSDLNVCSEGYCEPGPAKNFDRTAIYNYGNAQIIVERASRFSYTENSYVQVYLNQTNVWNTTIIFAYVPVWNQNYNTELIYDSTYIEFRWMKISDGNEYVIGGGSISVLQLVNRGLNGKEIDYIISGDNAIRASIVWTHL